MGIGAIANNGKHQETVAGHAKPTFCGANRKYQSPPPPRWKMAATRKESPTVSRPAVPSWEKEFCLKATVGLFRTWENFVEAKKFVHLYDNIMQWDDKEAQESFDRSKTLFYAKKFNCTDPDPDLYIDEINWNDSKIDDCKLTKELGPPTIDEEEEKEKEKESLTVSRPAVPSWEKEFCLKATVGLFRTWENFVEAKKFVHLFDKIMQWDDKEAQESFDRSKTLFYAKKFNVDNIFEISATLPDPDLYIDEINWNDSKIDDCKLTKELWPPAINDDEEEEKEKEKENESPTTVSRPAVPSWEKEFCLKATVGLFRTWENFVEAKKYVHLHNNIMQWDDKEAQESFDLSKTLFYAEKFNVGNIFEISATLSDLDLYIDDSKFDDCKLTKELGPAIDNDEEEKEKEKLKFCCFG